MHRSQIPHTGLYCTHTEITTLHFSFAMNTDFSQAAPPPLCHPAACSDSLCSTFSLTLMWADNDSARNITADSSVCKAKNTVASHCLAWQKNRQCWYVCAPYGYTLFMLLLLCVCVCACVKIRLYHTKDWRYILPWAMNATDTVMGDWYACMKLPDMTGNYAYGSEVFRK